MAQAEQLQPQEERPRFLSRTILTMTAATIAPMISAIIIVLILLTNQPIISYTFVTERLDSLVVSFAASRYGRKSMTTIPARTITAATVPMIFTLPVNKPPN